MDVSRSSAKGLSRSRILKNFEGRGLSSYHPNNEVVLRYTQKKITSQKNAVKTQEVNQCLSAFDDENDKFYLTESLLLHIDISDSSNWTHRQTGTVNIANLYIVDWSVQEGITDNSCKLLDILERLFLIKCINVFLRRDYYDYLHVLYWFELK